VESSSVPHLKGRFSALTSGNGVVWRTKTRQLTPPKRALRVGKSFRRPSQIFGAVFFLHSARFCVQAFMLLIWADELAGRRGWAIANRRRPGRTLPTPSNGAAAFGTMTLGVMTLGTTAFSTMGFSVTLSINDTQHNDTQHTH